MSRMTSKLSTALAGLALASLPVLVEAQSTSTQSTQQGKPRQSSGRTSQQDRSTRSTDPNSPQHHLNEAKRVLNSINTGSVQGEARKQITELKQHFTQLESAWRKRITASPSTTRNFSTFVWW